MQSECSTRTTITQRSSRANPLKERSRARNWFDSISKCSIGRRVRRSRTVATSGRLPNRCPPAEKWENRNHLALRDATRQQRTAWQGRTEELWMWREKEIKRGWVSIAHKKNLNLIYSVSRWLWLLFSTPFCLMHSTHLMRLLTVIRKEHPSSDSFHFEWCLTFFPSLFVFFDSSNLFKSSSTFYYGWF